MCVCVGVRVQLYIVSFHVWSLEFGQRLQCEEMIGRWVKCGWSLGCMSVGRPVIGQACIKPALIEMGGGGRYEMFL